MGFGGGWCGESEGDWRACVVDRLPFSWTLTLTLTLPITITITITITISTPTPTSVSASACTLQKWESILEECKVRPRQAGDRSPHFSLSPSVSRFLPLSLLWQQPFTPFEHSITVGLSIPPLSTHHPCKSIVKRWFFFRGSLLSTHSYGKS